MPSTTICATIRATVLRPGRGFDHTKRITIATLQTMILEYRDLSSGYFDLVITDECHQVHLR